MGRFARSFATASALALALLVPASCGLISGLGDLTRDDGAPDAATSDGPLSDAPTTTEAGGPCAVACDDHDPCTDDTCTGGGGCAHAANTAACDDGDPCTTADTCKRDVCFSGTVDAMCGSKTTSIFRSVGAGKVDALTTGKASGASMTLAGTTVLFSKALPDNVGVGDALQYDSNGDGTADALAFIHQRLTSTVYRVRTHDGTSPVVATDAAIWSVFRAYTSLNAAARTGDENVGIDPSLRNFDTGFGGQSVGTAQWNIACYADGIVDADQVTVCNAAYATTDCPAVGGGWTTSAAGYLRIFTPTRPSEVGTNQRHKGRWGEGYQRSASIIIQPGVNVRIDGMSIRQMNTDRTYLVLAPGLGAEIQITNSFGWSVQRTFDVWDGGYPHGVKLDVVKFFNDIGITDSTTDPAGAFYLNSSQITASVFNSTGIARAPSSGAFNGVYSVGTCKNCLAMQSGSAAGFLGSWIAVGASASNDGSASTFGASNFSNQTFSFLDSAGNDFHLAADASLNTGVRGKGENLSTSFATDIDGDARPSTGGWDIGADQVP